MKYTSPCVINLAIRTSAGDYQHINESTIQSLQLAHPVCTRWVSENLVIKGKMNGSQASPGVEPDHVEYRNAGGGNIERYGENIVNPCHLVVVHSATADQSGCQTRSIVGR